MVKNSESEMSRENVKMLVLYVAVETDEADRLGKHLADEATENFGLHVYGFEQRKLTDDEWTDLVHLLPT